MENTIKDCSEPFAELLAKKTFEKLFMSLSTDERARFTNASHMYRRAMKCKNCDGDVCLALLCSTIDAISNHRLRVHERFEQFLMEYCPENFRKSPLVFYQDLKPPEDYKKIQSSLDELRKQLREQQKPVNEFERAIDFVYSRFRCYFLHEAVGLAGTHQRSNKIKEPIEDLISPHFDLNYEKSLGIPVRIDPRIVEWFSKAVIVSLVQYLRTSHDEP
jgi:hypothetical protein